MALRNPFKTEQFRGVLDRVDRGWIYGWAWDAGSPEAPVSVDVHIDGEKVMTIRADQYRPDLQEAGIGSGKHAFQCELPRQWSDGMPHTVRVTLADSELDVSDSPRSGRISPIQPDPPPSYRSAFGGFWVDLSNAPAIIDGRESLGAITASQAEMLRSWVEDGFILLPGAVPVDLIDALNDDIEEVWSGRKGQGVYAESYGRGMVEVGRVRPEHKDQAAKLLDLYVHLESAREVVFADPIVDFLSLVFERPVMGFQCLYFQRGTEQPIHQDTAYVRVSSALELAASWVALEDIQPDSGELEYYVGSHRLPEYLFGGEHKWMPPGSDEHQRYLDRLHEQSAAMGLERRAFRPKKGDALLWSADLAHGGSPVKRAATRRSIVTHYCPVDRDPIYNDAGDPVKRVHHRGRSHYAIQQRA